MRDRELRCNAEHAYVCDDCGAFMLKLVHEGREVYFDREQARHDRDVEHATVCAAATNAAESEEAGA